MSKIFTKKYIFIYGCITYILAYVIYLYFAEKNIFWKSYYYVKDYAFMLFLLVNLKNLLFSESKFIAFLIVMVFQYFNFNIAMVTKTLTDFEKYCNSQVFSMMLANTVLSLLFFISMTNHHKHSDNTNTDDTKEQH